MSRHWGVLLIGVVLGWAAAPGMAQQGRERAERPQAEESDPAYPDQPVAPQGPVFQRRAADREDSRFVPSRQTDVRDPADRDYGPARVAQTARDTRTDPPPRGREAPADPRAGSPAPATTQVVQPPIPPPTREEEQRLDKVLAYWEKCSAKVKDFECKLVRLEYNGDDKKPLEDRGELKYLAPDRGLIEIAKPREEKWICDGKAIYQYNFQAKQVQEFKLPPELQGHGISEGPLPFIFGANQAQLKRRYFLQIVTPKDVDANAQVWVEAFPRYQDDARNFRSVEIILQINKDMMPSAMKVVQPNGNNYTVYLFEKVVVNAWGRRIEGVFTGNWWEPKLPDRDWQLVPDPSVAPPERTRQPSTAAGKAASAGARSGQNRR